jgi:hypothetical protein
MYEWAKRLTDAKNKWQFLDPPNTAVFTSARVLDGEDWVHYVAHDDQDGAWQFHPFSGPTSEAEATVVSLERMLKLDPSIEELADLPLGWHAWRDDENSPWARAPTQS